MTRLSCYSGHKVVNIAHHAIWSLLYGLTVMYTSLSRHHDPTRVVYRALSTPTPHNQQHQHRALLSTPTPSPPASAASASPMAHQIDVGMPTLDKKLAWDAPAGGNGGGDSMSSPGAAVAVHPAAFIGNPAPLGLAAFGMTTCFLMFTDAAWAEPATVGTIICYAVAYGGFAQMVAGVLELIKGNTFAGTAFFSYGSFWVAYFITKFIATSPTAAGHAAFKGASAFVVGETLIMAWWSMFTFGFFVCTLRKNVCLMTVFGTLTITFALLAGGQWSETCTKAAGYVGFVCGSSAIYTAFAEIWHENLGIMAPGLRPVRFI